MGTDIHVFLEGTIDEAPRASAIWFYIGEIPIDRNSHLYAALAGITDRGQRGQVWGMNVKPVRKLRGWPATVSPELNEKTKGDPDFLEAFGHGWLTVEELLEYDWNQVVHHKAHVDTSEPEVREWWERGDRTRAPPTYAAGVVGAPGPSITVAEWSEPLRAYVTDFVEIVLPYLRYASGSNPEDDRVVFYFTD